MNEKQLMYFFEENEFIVHLFEQDGIQCAEIEMWTDGGVDMIITLNPFTVEEFMSYVNNFSIDEQIDLHRQGDDYKKVFSISASLHDFTKYYNYLKTVLEELLKLNREIKNGKV